MSKRRVSRTIYMCDGPNCEVETQDENVISKRWIIIRAPNDNETAYLHRVECAIAYLSTISHGFDTAVIRAHIGQPVPAGRDGSAES